MDELVEALRPKAFAIAYRMLGSVADAEDVVQEALLRLHRTLAAGERVASPEAFVATVVTRLAIDELRSARARRTSYVGEWLPEPLVTDDDADPAQRAELADSLSLAFLVLLERLSPAQRAVFLLRDVFDYPYDRIAEILGRSPAAVRQLAVRARRQVGEGRPRFRPGRRQHARLAERFFGAVEAGRLEELESLLAADVVLHGDGGGNAPALARPVHGRARVARTLRAWVRAAGVPQQTSVSRASLNGQPGALLHDRDGRTVGAVALELRDGEIVAVRSIVNPGKLRHLGPVAAATLRGTGSTAPATRRRCRGDAPLRPPAA